jgi:drug/metabolite transporter (DMT)-like permease
MKLLGILFIVAGIIGVLYGGFTYTSHKKAVDMGPIQIEKKEHHTVPIPPILGAVAILAGCAMVFGSGKNAA